MAAAELGRRQSLAARGTNAGLWALFCITAATAILSGSPPRAAEAPAANLRYLQDPTAAAVGDLRIIDTRPEASCRGSSVVGAVCLPPEAFFGPHRRLASFRDIAWVLGTAGLRGDEAVLVLGNDPVRRDAVAALLYLSGQSRVSVLDGPMDALFDPGGSERAAGRTRGILRDPIRTEPWREDRILLRDELAEALADGCIGRLLDGRTADEYWGERIRARRGGHLPGAELAPASQLRGTLARGETGRYGFGGAPPVQDGSSALQNRGAAPSPGPSRPRSEEHKEGARRDFQGGDDAPVVAYAHDPLTGLAYLTLLRAGFGLDATLYLGGWREWADDGRLPVDAVSYAEPGPMQAPSDGPAAEHGQPLRSESVRTWSHSLLALAAVVSAGGFGYLLGRRTT